MWNWAVEFCGLQIVWNWTVTFWEGVKLCGTGLCRFGWWANCLELDCKNWGVANL
jgi:hypothetical protein